LEFIEISEAPMRYVARALLVSLLGSLVAVAQDKPATPPAKPGPQPPAKPATKPADPPPAKPAAKAGTPPEREEHVVYVPFRNLREVFEKSDMSVMLPYAQFLELWNRVQGLAVPPPVKPPMTGVITRADYVGAVDGELARIQATLVVDVLGDEWARLPVQFGEASVGEARSADAAILVRGTGDGSYELLARGKGTHTVVFDLVARVTSAADGKSFLLACPPVGVSNLEITIPEADVGVQVTPRRTSQNLPAEKGRTRIRAAIGSTDRIHVAWQPRAGQLAEVAGLASVTDTIEIDVGDGIVHTHAVFDYQILRGSLDALTITMPADQRLLDVQVPGLRDWQTEAADGRQKLTVRLHAPVRDKVRLELRTESPIPAQAFPLASLQAVAAARESGLVAVRSAEDLGLEFTQHEAVTRVDAADVPQPLRKPRSTFYKFYTPSFRLQALATALEPRVTADSNLTITIDKTRTALRGDFKYDVTRAGIFALRVRLPAGFNLDEVQCRDMDRHEVASADGASVLTVHLAKKLLGELPFSVTMSQPRAMASGTLDLPLLEPLGMALERGLVAVLAPAALEVNSDPMRLESARPATPEELAARGFQPAVPANMRVAAAFSFSRRPVQIGLATRERPRQVYATVSTVAAAKEDVVTVTTRVGYDVQYAGTDTLHIAVPAHVADRIQVQGDGIKEQRKTAKPEADGMLALTIVLHTELLGARQFTLTYDDKLAVPARGSADVRVLPIRLLGVDRETGELAVVKDRALALAATPEGLEEIDPRELTPSVGSEQPYLSYRYFRHPAKLALSVTKHELEGVVRTVVPRAYIEAVTNREGPITMRARYLVKSSERQRLRVSLPAQRVLGISVAGRNTPPEKAPEAAAAPASGSAEYKPYYINVARGTGPDEPFPIAIVYEAAAPPGGKLSVTSDLRLPMPRFEDGVKFQQLYVRLWLPRQYRAVGEPAGFNNETRRSFDPFGMLLVNTAPEDPDTWFASDAGTFDFRAAGHAYLYSSLTGPASLTTRYWHIATMTFAASVAMLLVGVAALRFRFEGKVALVFALVLAVLFAALFWPEATLSWLVAARIGIVAALAVWLVRFVVQVGRATPMRLAAAGAGSVLLSAAAAPSAAAVPEPPAPAPATGPPESPPPEPPAAEPPAAEPPAAEPSLDPEKGGTHDAP
jgi:hypothetical protein